MQAIATDKSVVVACFLLVEWAGVFKGQLIFYYGGIRTEVCAKWRDFYIGLCGRRELKRKDVGSVA